MIGSNLETRKVVSTTAIVLLVLLAGCVGPIDDPTGLLGGDNAENKEPLDAVPQESNVVVQVDPVGFLQDQTTRDMGNYVLQEFTQNESSSFSDEINNSFEEFNNQLQSNLSNENIDVNIQAQDLGNIIIFADSEQIESGPLQATPSALQQQASGQNISEQYAGAIVELDLTEEQLQSLFNAVESEAPDANQSSFSQEQYNGYPIFTVEEDNQSVSLALLDTGIHAFGPTHVVEDTIDTFAGDRAAVDKSIVPNNTENTYLSVGSNDVNETVTGVSDQIDAISEDPTLESVLFTYSTDNNNTVETTTDLTFNSTQAPFQMRLQSEDSLENLRGTEGSNQSSLVGPIIGTDNVQITSEQQTLSIDYEFTTGELEEVIDSVSEGGFVPTPPQGSIETQQG